MNNMFTFYEVGGKIRDELLGLQSKDIDYVAVPRDSLIDEFPEADDLFKVLEDYLKREKFNIFLSTPHCYTIRAKFPEGHVHKGVADFVMSRKEIGYIPWTRTPIIKPGNLRDDLERRDFTINAMARDSEGNLIDLFGGQEDLKNKILRTPLDTETTFNDDPLRILRAIRFAITKEFTFTSEMAGVIRHYDYEVKMAVVSAERIREELYKCFKHNTLETLTVLDTFPALKEYIFMTKIWLKPTIGE
jgi:poly(A) polymerase